MKKFLSFSALTLVGLLTMYAYAAEKPKQTYWERVQQTWQGWWKRPKKACKMVEQKAPSKKACKMTEQKAPAQAKKPESKAPTTPPQTADWWQRTRELFGFGERKEVPRTKQS